MEEPIWGTVFYNGCNLYVDISYLHQLRLSLDTYCDGLVDLGDPDSDNVLPLHIVNNKKPDRTDHEVCREKKRISGPYGVCG
ncbi:MAG: hypothetical protein QXE27_00020 [Thermoplasmata archaeon]